MKREKIERTGATIFIILKRKKILTAAVGIFAVAAAFLFLGNKFSFGESQTMNQAGKDTKEIVVIDAGHGGIQTRPKKSGLAKVGGCRESCADVGYTHLSYKQSIQGVNL